MVRVDTNYVEDCLKRIQGNQRRQDDRINIILDKLNYIMIQQEHTKKECKAKLNGIYGYKHEHFLTTSELYKSIPFSTFDLFINNEMVKRQCTWEEFFNMKEGLYSSPLNAKIDLKKALNRVVSVEIPCARTTSVNLLMIEGEF